MFGWQLHINIYLHCVCVCVFGFNVAFNNFSVVSRRCLVATGSSMLTYSAASLKYHVPDPWHDTTPSHIILTLGRQVLAPPRKSSAKRGAARDLPFPGADTLPSYRGRLFTCKFDFLITSELIQTVTSNPWPPVPRSRHSTNWAIRAGYLHVKLIF